MIDGGIRTSELSWEVLNIILNVISKTATVAEALTMFRSINNINFDDLID